MRGKPERRQKTKFKKKIEVSSRRGERKRKREQGGKTEETAGDVTRKVKIKSDDGRE